MAASLTACKPDSDGDSVPGGTPGGPRNILLIITDQHRPDAVGAYGDPYARTPNLDALANESVNFRRAYVNCPICVPSRFSFLTSRYLHQTGTLRNISTSSDRDTTLPQILRAHGYATGSVGKLHNYGRDKTADWDLHYERDWLSPRQNIPEGAEMLPTAVIGGPNAQLGSASPIGARFHTESVVVEQSKLFMQEHQDRPWFLHCSFRKPHPPFQPPRSHWRRAGDLTFDLPDAPDDAPINPLYRDFMAQRRLTDATHEQKREAMRGYYGNLNFVDEQIGAVLTELDELGLADDTLVIYISDHGEALWDHNLLLKGYMYDPVVRVPLMVRDPRLPRERTDHDALVELVDLAPTALAFAGIDVQASPHRAAIAAMQGHDVLPLCRAEADAVRTHAFSSYHHANFLYPAVHMVTDGRFKYIDNGPEVPAELYDLQEDPREFVNRAEDPAHAERRAELEGQLAEWLAKEPVPEEPPFAKYVERKPEIQERYEASLAPA